MSEIVRDGWIASTSQPLELTGEANLFPISFELEHKRLESAPRYLCFQGLHNVEQLGILDIHVSPVDSVLSEQTYLATAAFYGVDTQSDSGQELKIKLSQQGQQTLLKYIENKQFITLIVALQSNLNLSEKVTIERIGLL